MADRTERDEGSMRHIPDIAATSVKPMMDNEHTAFGEASTALMRIALKDCRFQP
jgi:hypothetical protein